MTNKEKLYEEGLSISQVTNGKSGIYLRQVNGQPVARVTVWQRVLRSLAQAKGQMPSRHPNGWPELHLDDGSVGCLQTPSGEYLIHPRAIELSEEWRIRSSTVGDTWYGTYPNRGPVVGTRSAVDKPVMAKSKEVATWLRERKAEK